MGFLVAAEHKQDEIRLYVEAPRNELCVGFGQKATEKIPLRDPLLSLHDGKVDS